MCFDAVGWAAGRACHPAYKKLSGGMLAWLSVWGKVQIFIWPNWCRCHSLSLAAVNPGWFYLHGFTFLVSAHLGSPSQSPGGHQTVNRCSKPSSLLSNIQCYSAGISK